MQFVKAFRPQIFLIVHFLYSPFGAKTYIWTLQQVKPRVNKAQTAVETAGVKHSMNPFDELSIEESVRIRERHGKDTVTDILAFSCGQIGRASCRERV